MAGSSLRDVHQSVLLEETVTMLQVVPGGIYMDGTFGLGGHTKEILKHSAPDGEVVAFDWDAEAIQLGLENVEPYRDRLTVIHRNFAEIDIGLEEAGHPTVDGILIDIGLSSLQLDSDGRGFSFRKDEALDMRMDRRRPITAAHIIADTSEKELADLFYYYGDEKQARRIAAHVVDMRSRQKIETTGQLADIVSEAVPKRFQPAKIHVATKVFQALRIAVNGELANLGTMLEKAADHLRTGGRICIIAFHSLEDRIVKRALNSNPELLVITKKPIVPGEVEIQRNPRSRSARLRVAERVA